MYMHIYTVFTSIITIKQAYKSCAVGMQICAVGMQICTVCMYSMHLPHFIILMVKHNFKVFFLISIKYMSIICLFISLIDVPGTAVLARYLIAAINNIRCCAIYNKLDFCLCLQRAFESDSSTERSPWAFIKKGDSRSVRVSLLFVRGIRKINTGKVEECRGENYLPFIISSIKIMQLFTLAVIFI